VNQKIDAPTEEKMDASREDQDSSVEFFIGLLIFALFLVAYILLGARDGVPVSTLSQVSALYWLKESGLLLPLSTLIGGSFGAICWRLAGLSGRYGRSTVATSAEVTPRSSVPHRQLLIAVLLVGAVVGVFCGFVLPAAVLRGGEDFADYNTRALALLSVFAGYGGCNSFGNIGRLLSDILSSRQPSFDAATLRQAIDVPLRETLGAKLEERFSPPDIPRYKAYLSSELFHNGDALTGQAPTSAPILLIPELAYTLSIRLGPADPESAHSMRLQNDAGPTEAEVPFDIEVDADLMSVTPARLRLVLGKSGGVQSADVKLTPIPRRLLSSAEMTEDQAPESIIRVSAYCRGSPAGRLLIAYTIPRSPVLP
jgi:hypothetical protein